MSSKRKQETEYNGVLLIDKPLHKSSHDVVQDVRRTLHMRRVGHSGTLDPLAEGLLVACLGSATKVVQFLVGHDKTYEAEIFLGLTSKTYDREGVTEEDEVIAPPDMTRDELVAVLDEFTGRVTQQVPAYSAVRVEGEPLYKKARRGEEVTPPSREVTIHEIELLSFDPPRLKIRVDCSSGTYIRTLAHDIGQRLGCGAYLSGLRRTRVGKMSIDDALTMEEVARFHEADELGEHLLGYDAVLDFSALTISDDFRPGVIQGRTVGPNDITGFEGDFSAGDTVVLKDSDGVILAVGTAEVDSDRLSTAEDTNLFSYKRVLN